DAGARGIGGVVVKDATVVCGAKLNFSLNSVTWKDLVSQNRRNHGTHACNTILGSAAYGCPDAGDVGAHDYSPIGIVNPKGTARKRTHGVTNDLRRARGENRSNIDDLARR